MERLQLTSSDHRRIERYLRRSEKSRMTLYAAEFRAHTRKPDWLLVGLIPDGPLESIYVSRDDIHDLDVAALRFVDEAARELVVFSVGHDVNYFFTTLKNGVYEETKDSWGLITKGTALVVPSEVMGTSRVILTRGLLLSEVKKVRKLLCFFCFVCTCRIIGDFSNTIKILEDRFNFETYLLEPDEKTRGLA